MIGLTLNVEWNSNTPIYIYAIYQNGKDMYFYGADSKVGGELYAFKQRDIKIIDPNITFDMVYLNDNDGFMMLHWALFKDKLLDKVVDRDTDALELFSKLRWIDNKREID